MLLHEPLFRALDASVARHVVVGGVATVLHGMRVRRPISI